jgi:two-component system, chemotaxis family, CheB/CheR fusion protein
LQSTVAVLLASKAPDEPIRVWSAGCASGEETYTLMMVLAEALGIDRLKQHVKIYATDANEEALNHARLAMYNSKTLAPVPEHMRAKYFEPMTTGWCFRQDLRRTIIFGRHDLVSDAPISRLDLLVCRNTLIYFNAEAQSRILARFNFAMKPDGHLFLGKSEMLLTHGRLFTPVDANARIFRKASHGNLRDHLAFASPRRENRQQPSMLTRLQNQQVDMRELSFENAPVSQVILDVGGTVVLANLAARRNFRVDQRDIGKPIQDLELSYRPLEIRSRIEEAMTSRLPVTEKSLETRTPDGEPVFYDVQVEPLIGESDELLGTIIAFVDVTTSHLLRLQVERAQHELETAYEEVQASNEELETTNEELQSSIEELETTNEELQSTNEELETLNEELQSTNEEMETLNEELRRRTRELDASAHFMEMILRSMDTAVLVTDHNLVVQMWSQKAEDLWGLRPSEVEGRKLTDLDAGISFAEFEQQFRACLMDGEASRNVVDAINRRGKPVRIRVSCNRMQPDAGPPSLLVLMEEWNDR